MNGKQIIGLIIVLFGISILLDQFTIFSGLGYMLRTYWPLLVIAVGIHLLQKGSRGSAMLFIVLGLMFQVAMLFDVNVFALIFPVFIIWLGFKLLIPDTQEHAEHIHTFTDSSTSQSDESVLNETAIFSQNRKKFTNKNFKGGTVTSIFSESIIDLSEIDFQAEQVVVELTAVFGSIEVKAPSNIHVISNGTPVLGEYQNRTATQQDPTNKKIIFTGSSVFSGVTIVN